MNKKRLLSLILAALICLTILPLSVFAYGEDEIDIVWLEEGYDEVRDFREDLVCALSINEKYGFLDKNLNVVIPAIYDYVNSFSNGLATVVKGDKYGFINKAGKEVVPCIYDAAGSFSDGLALVQKNGLYGYIDTSGKEVIPCKYGNAFPFSDGLAAVTKDPWGYGEWGYIDKSGREVIPFKYEKAYPFFDGMAQVENGDTYGYFIDTSGNQKFSYLYNSYFVEDYFYEGLVLVQKDNKFGFINKNGELAIPFIYDFAKSFSDGMALVEKNGKFGYIDTSGKEVIPCIYDDVSMFSEGLAIVLKNGKCGYIDKNGKEIVPYIFDNARLFFSGVAWVNKNDRWGIITNPLSAKPPATPDPTAGASNWAVPIIKEAIDTGIVPKNLQKNYTSSVTRAEVAEMFVKLIEAASGKSIDAFLAEKGKAINPAAFTDTSDRNVLACNALGIINGKGNNKFDPSGYLKRAEIAAVLYNMAKAMGINTKGYTHNFTDTQNHWCNDLLGWPVYAKIVSGKGNNRFDPEGQLTVEQTITICLNALKAIKQ
ncbi:MAG: hypothetical protein GX975_05655 [Clostridiales bacterium]|nr:hypothetical protein [Clostridiales bacterium]